MFRSFVFKCFSLNSWIMVMCTWCEECFFCMWQLSLHLDTAGSLHLDFGFANKQNFELCYQARSFLLRSPNIRAMTTNSSWILSMKYINLGLQISLMTNNSSPNTCSVLTYTNWKYRNRRLAQGCKTCEHENCKSFRVYYPCCESILAVFTKIF